MNENVFSRRRLLSTGVQAAGIGVVLAAGVSVPAAAAAETAWTGTVSANGWPIIRTPAIVPVEGADVAVAVLPGPVATVLVQVARRFHYEIASRLEPGDIVGHTTNRTVAVPYESNYLSGTAIAIRPGAHPRGVRGGFFDHEVMVIRDILAECQGVVRWGGDLDPPQESHFQIDLVPTDPRIRMVAKTLTLGNERPGRGAGSPVDVADPVRREKARVLAGQQRSR